MEKTLNLSTCGRQKKDASGTEEMGEGCLVARHICQNERGVIPGLGGRIKRSDIRKKQPKS